VLGISRHTVKSALASAGPPRYQRTPAGSMVDGVEPRIRELLKAVPRMPATVIAVRIAWSHSIRTLSARVAQLRPVYLPPDPASRTSYVAGEVAQCDLWFPPIVLPVEFRADPPIDSAAGADDGDRVFAVAVRGADPDPLRAGVVRRLVAADRGVGGGATAAGLGRGGARWVVRVGWLGLEPRTQGL
jgi:hypothetical protein